MEAYESIAAAPEFQSAFQAATDNDTEIAKFNTKRRSDFGGYYLADVSLHVFVHVFVVAFVRAPALVLAHVP